MQAPPVRTGDGRTGVSASPPHPGPDRCRLPEQRRYRPRLRPPSRRPPRAPGTGPDGRSARQNEARTGAATSSSAACCRGSSGADAPRGLRHVGPEPGALSWAFGPWYGADLRCCFFQGLSRAFWLTRLELPGDSPCDPGTARALPSGAVWGGPVWPLPHGCGAASHGPGRTAPGTWWPTRCLAGRSLDVRGSSAGPLRRVAVRVGNAGGS